MVEKKKKKLRRSEVREQLNEIVKLFYKFPKIKSAKSKRNPLKSAVKKAEANIEKQIHEKDSLQELIDYLRVCIKYMIFDAEAYERENEYLRKLLKDENGK